MKQLFLFFKEEYTDLEVSIYPNCFQILFSDRKYCEWTDMCKEEFKEKEDTKFLLKEQIQTIMMITHHTYHFYAIKPIIQKCLENFGGLIGNDNNGFIPIYNIENFSGFCYSWQRYK